MDITITLTEKELQALNFCLFTLNYLTVFEDELENLQGGFQAVAETAAEKAALLHSAVWTQAAGGRPAR